jgi:hypothetical protein
MKKIVFFSFCLLPIVAYLFFASGVNGFTKLPTITPNTADLGNWESLDKKVSLNGKVTFWVLWVLNFKNRGNLLI